MNETLTLVAIAKDLTLSSVLAITLPYTEDISQRKLQGQSAILLFPINLFTSEMLMEGVSAAKPSAKN